MSRRKHICAAMSGGVDSSVVARLLLDEGHVVSGATMVLHEESAAATADVADARAVCDRLGLAHRVYDMRKAFRRAVMEDFAAVYEAGETPNPCVVCNREIKFGALLDAVLADGADALATGHFARIGYDAGAGRHLILRAKDADKDQSYVLWQLSQAVLARVVLPLGELTKAEVRAMATEAGFVTAHKSDSQDICFVPDGDYATFLHRLTGRTPEPGDFVGPDGQVLGQHRGILHYTIGQRKGLGIAHSAPLFVLDKDPVTRRVTLTEGEGLFRREIPLRGLNLVALASLPAALRCEAKLRYGHKAAPATLYPTGEGEAMLVFDEPQRAPAPGQSAVFYDGDILLGGGLIMRSRKC